ncbi:MAG: hypothetical protein LC645_01485 [Geobacteraceae bacterium]|nr:hypothetical protein [Geobacteraceae bacterium]
MGLYRSADFLSIVAQNATQLGQGTMQFFVAFWGIFMREFNMAEMVEDEKAGE